MNNCRYIITPSSCQNAEVVINDITYKRQSSNELYVSLLYGVCDKSNSCIAWSDSKTWKTLDAENFLVSDYKTDFESAAKFSWPNAYNVTIVSLVIIVLLVIFFVVAIIIKDVKWEWQIASVIVQFILLFCVVFILAYGLSTDTVLPGSWRTVYMGCNIHTEPGAGWWGGLIAALITLFSAVLMLFPYMMGPQWVAFGYSSRVSSEASSSSSESNWERRHRHELERDDEDDPYMAVSQDVRSGQKV